LGGAQGNSALRRPYLPTAASAGDGIGGAGLFRQVASTAQQAQHSTVDLLAHVSDVVMGQRLQCMKPRGA